MRLEIHISTLPILILALRLAANGVPFQGQPRILVISASGPGSKAGSASLADWVAWKTRCTSLQHIALYQPIDANVTINGKEVTIPGYSVWNDFFETIGMNPTIGRAFRPEEMDEPSDVVIITDRAWRRFFGADPAIIGRTVYIDGSECTVAGVMPRAFNQLGTGDVVRPFTPRAFEGSGHDAVFKIIAILKLNVTEQHLTEELAKVQTSRKEDEGHRYTIFDVKVSPFVRL